MRKQINIFAGFVQKDLYEDPSYVSLFLFCNKQRKLLKILYGERIGFCLWLQRLERVRFPWADAEKQIRSITVKELRMLIDGIYL